MATKAKSKLASIMGWVLIGLLVIALAGFSLTNFGGGADAMAKVGNERVTANEYYRAVQADLRDYQVRYQGQITPDMYFGERFNRGVVNQLVLNAALNDELSNLGLSTGDQELATTLRQLGDFQGLDGDFDREGYAASLRQQGLNEAQYEANLRKDISRSTLLQALDAGVVAPAYLIDFLDEFQRGRRDFAWTQISEENLATPIGEPTEADLVAFHSENPEAFTIPEKKTIDYVWITPSQLAQTIEIDEALMREQYTERAEEYNVPERRAVDRLVFSDDAAATAALARITAGEITFEGLVTERGLTLADVDLGELGQDGLGNEAAEAIFALEQPQVVGPLPSALGPALYQLNAILSARSVSFEEASPGLRDELATEYSARAIDAMIEDLENDLAGGVLLSELAETSDLSFGTVDWSPEMSEGITGYAAFQEAAFEVTEDTFEQIMQLEDGGIFAIKMTGTVPAQLQELTEVRDAVADSWREAAVATALTDLGNTLVTQVAEGADPATLGLTVNLEIGLTRTAYIDLTPVDMITQVFEMLPGEARIVQDAQGVFLIRLDGISPADPNDPDAQTGRQQLSDQLGQALSRDLLVQFATSLQSQKDVSINSAVINAVHNQMMGIGGQY